MHRLTLPPLVLALLVFANGCASSHKHAEVPDFTEKGWSEPNPAYSQSKADTSIQAPVAKNDDSATTTTTAAEVPASAGTSTPDATTATGTPAPNAVKPGKAKKAGTRKKGKKKDAKTT